MQNAMAFFLARLILGVACFGWAFSRADWKVVSPFFRILMLLVLGLGVVFGLTAPQAVGWWLMLLVPVLAFIGSVVWLLERRSVGRIVFLLCSLLSTFWIGEQVWGGPENGGLLLALNALSQVASTATLGTALCGMLLGHRYLTAPGMPLEPLQGANTALGIAGLLRLAASVGALILGMSALGGTTHLVWFALRWLAGIGGPIVVWWLVRRILVFRNTQSATGVLFVGVILTFIGELTGDILFRSTGYPF